MITLVTAMMLAGQAPVPAPEAFAVLPDVPAPACAVVDLSADPQQRLHLRLAGYSSDTGPRLALDIDAAAGTVWLIRIGAARFGDARSTPSADAGGAGGTGGQDVPIARAALDALAASATLDVVSRDGRTLTYRLDTGGLAGLRACIDALPPATIAPAAAPDGWTFWPLEANRLPRYLRRGRVDYPDAALRAGAEGSSVAKVEIAATGEPQSCVIRTSSGSADLDARTCAGVMRSTFRAPTDAAGEPQPGTVLVPYRWVIGD